MSSPPQEHGPSLNTDRELWRERPDDYYAPSIFVTEGGGIGLNVGGFVFVKPIRDWFALAEAAVPPRERYEGLHGEVWYRPASPPPPADRAVSEPVAALPAAKWYQITGPSDLPHCRAYGKQVGDGHLTVFVGREPVGPGGALRWHLSISHRSNSVLNAHGAPAAGRIPTWEEIHEARYRFLPDEIQAAMILPPQKDYVNLHETTMHLYEIGADQ